jgi:cephalosporin hydroxylase
MSDQCSSISRPPLFAPTWPLGWIARSVLPRYNRLRRALFKPQPRSTKFYELDEVRRYALTISDIDEHLELMFIEALLARPQLIVELGVRGGASTFVFGRAARCCGASLISADLDDCSSACPSSGWHFFQGDDLYFAAIFREFCAQRTLEPAIDLLFIDTSHYYGHTRDEISAWFPFLSARAKVIFHDTNMRVIGRRNDGGFATGWNNQRGVVRAIEEYLGIHIGESHRFVGHARGWLVRHWPNCNGLTILDRLS